MGPGLASGLLWKPQRCCRVGVAASRMLSVFSGRPLRLQIFDLAKVMFVRCAAIAITAVRKPACLGEEKILGLYLKQAKDKRSMAQFRLRIGGESSQTWWEIIREREV